MAAARRKLRVQPERRLPWISQDIGSPRLLKTGSSAWLRIPRLPALFEAAVAEAEVAPVAPQLQFPAENSAASMLPVAACAFPLD